MSEQTMHLPVSTIGFIRQTDVPIEDYEDFLHLRQSVAEVKDSLKRGHFPPGLYLKDDTCGGKFRVMGPYGEEQRLERIN